MPPLLILALFSAIAIAAVGVLLHKLGATKTFAFKDEKQAQDIFLAEFPEQKIISLMFSEDRQVAIVRLESSIEIGLVRAVGYYPVARILAAIDISDVALTERQITLSLSDYSDPKSSFAFPSIKEATDWAKMFAELKNGERHAANA